MNYASRLERLEQQADDCAVRVVLIQPGESELGAVDRIASAGDPNAVRRAHAAGRICFLTWADMNV